MKAMTHDDTEMAVPISEAEIADRLSRALVDAYPMTLTALGPLGIDLCCGGGHPLGEALDLHGLDRDTVLPRVAQIIADSAPEQE